MSKLTLLLLLAGVVLASAWTCPVGIQEGQCINRKTFCWKGRVYQCANSNFECDGFGPCVSKIEYPRLPGAWKRYACLNNMDFANGGVVKRCAPGTKCGKPRRAGESPCLRGRWRGACPNGQGGCIDNTHYCEQGQIYKCASGLRCAGFPSAPLGYGAGAVVSPCAKRI